MVKDPGFQEAAAKRKLVIAPTPGTDVQGIIQKVVSYAPAVIERARSRFRCQGLTAGWRYRKSHGIASRCPCFECLELVAIALRQRDIVKAFEQAALAQWVDVEGMRLVRRGRLRFVAPGPP